MDVTWNIPACGYGQSGMKIPEFETWDGKTFSSLDELKKYCRENGIRATVTPCENTGSKSYHGNGGYRYLHDKKFTVE